MEIKKDITQEYSAEEFLYLSDKLYRAIPNEVRDYLYKAHNYFNFQVICLRKNIYYPEKFRGKTLITRTNLDWRHVYDIELFGKYHKHDCFLIDSKDAPYFQLIIPREKYGNMYNLDECLYKIVNDVGLLSN